MKTGIELIAEERQRQIQEEGWSAEHDDKYKENELAKAAGCYAVTPGLMDEIKFGNRTPSLWPFSAKWWRPSPANRIRELQKAGALIAAEIDRIQRENN
jgi:hypothetical protein